ncbi:MAG: glycosyltransferase family 2 protein [Candidatus Gastranaerophilaceae bacterium]
MSKISVIVPVYNTRKFLKKCLDSIINQTFKDIEIICINDGSTDKKFICIKRICTQR